MLIYSIGIQITARILINYSVRKRTRTYYFLLGINIFNLILFVSEQNVTILYLCIFVYSALQYVYLFQRHGGTHFGNGCIRFWLALAIVLYNFHRYSFAGLFLERVIKLVFHNVCHLRGVHAHRLELRAFGFQLFFVVQ